MLKAISTITNALGALNYKGTWNASSNTPTLADGTGAKGDYYVVSTAGTQTFGGVQLFFGTGDWIAYNGAVWQRVEGGSDGNFANVTLTSTDAGATANPTLDLYRDSASPAASDTLGEIEFNGEDSAGNKQTYGLIHGSILSPTSTAEQGQLHFETATAGALTEKMIIGTTNLVINEIGAVFNVRIEGDTDANLFCTDATNSRVGVGTVGPTAKLDVVGGDIRIDNGNLIVGTSGKGIDFSITSHPASMTSELLADYEEGTWTPTVAAASVTYTNRYGTYTKIGNVVYISCFVQIATITSPTGGAGSDFISGLPFTSLPSTNAYYPNFATSWNGSNFGGTVGMAQMGSSSTALSALASTNNAAFVDSSPADIWDANGNWVKITGFYFV
jgi:hypothetical protein